MVLGIAPTWAQRDTLFWFALPDTHIQGLYHGRHINHVTFEEPITYTHERPALEYNTYNLNTGSQPPYFNTQFVLNSFSAEWNNYDSVCPYNAVSNFGYCWRSTAECQQMLYMQNRNTESYMLKGKHALGTHFMVPAQWQFPNYSQFTDARNSVEVVATEHNTVLTITPTVDLFGGTHPAGVPFNVSLNRGQVYCFAAAAQSAEGHLGGTQITSNKPVVVNLTDDAVTTGGDHFDVVGDQLIPEEEAGVDYIAVPAPATAVSSINGQFTDYALIYALEDNTDVTVHNTGSPAQYSNLYRGDRQAYQFTQHTPAFITATKPVLVFQLTGSGGELAGSMLTPLTCHGSRSVNFGNFPPGTDWTAQKSTLTYICEEEFIDGFHSASYTTTTGNEPMIPTDTFYLNTLEWHAIPDTTLMYAQFELTTTWPCIYTFNSLGPFYMHAFEYSYNETEVTGVFSNYIADFPREPVLSWTLPTSYCLGDSIFLTYTAKNVENIQLFGPDNEELFTDTIPNAQPEHSGYYIITGITTSCRDFISDTVWIGIYRDTLTHLETEVCSGKPYQSHGFWISAEQTDSVGRIIHDTLFLQTSHGCDSTVALQLTVVDQPTVEILVPEDDFCDVGEIVLTALSGASEYLWSTGAETPFISAVQSGHYTVTASIGDCFATASADIPPCDLVVYLPNTITPSRGDGLNDCLRLPELLIHRISDFSLSLYDRWGEQVFVTNDPHFTWCGEGVHLSDVYVYVLRLKDQNGKPFVYRGTVTVL